MHRQLFLDDANIAGMDGLRRTMHQPLKHSANPVVPADKPWENMTSVYGTTMYDEHMRRFRMWYLIGCPSDGEFTDADTGERYPIPQTTRVGYAESDDGVTWAKPDLGQLEWRGSTANNMLAIGRQNPEGMSVLVDERDPDPAHRYKALFWDHAADGCHYHQELKRVLWRETTDSDGAYLAWSGDGIHWTHSPHNPVIKAYMDTSQNLLWDPRIERYVAFSRFGFGRKIARSESEGFVHWSEPQLVLECDEADGEASQFYGAGIDVYEGLYVGMLWLYREGGDGCIDTQLGVSRDGIRWERVADRQVFLPLGDPGSWDDGMARCAERIIRVGDQLYIYYSGVNGPHSGPKFPADTIVRKSKPGIGLCTLRRDGFVSLDAGTDGGSLLARPFPLPAGRLHLNIDARNGRCVVALQHQDGSVIPGFEQSQPISGDRLDAEVNWRGDTWPSVGQTVALRIALENASLYSYWFD
ncbi:MAG: hypothetical protein JSV65_07675 [Armatimonadota bacterium]|nr:MAG: hypothetical protein JSV65_07675 [Armatimonadota bacterium]